MAAIYTIELCELIQYYAPSDAPLIDPDVIYNAGAKFVPMDAVNMLNSAHRKAFLEGFLLHYFNFEIAYPTLAAWQIAFFDKLYNNHEYIDQVIVRFGQNTANARLTTNQPMNAKRQGRAVMKPAKRRPERQTTHALTI